MKRRFTLTLSTLVVLNLLPVHTLSAIVPTVEATVRQHQEDSLMSLGATLNADQTQMTKRLLSGTEVPDKNILRVDGPMINKYLQDGSTQDTQVYSSAIIQPKEAGYGIQVQIVTPQNIQQVSASTYQNAAITAGAKDVLIRVATVTPVTGEGALAGVYALLEKSGVKLSPEDTQRAQSEITIINQLVIDVPPKVNINIFIGELKVFVINNLQHKHKFDKGLQDEIKRLLKESGLSDKEIDDFLKNEETINLLRKLLEDFSKTHAAQDKKTSEAIKKSIVNNTSMPWGELLPTLTDRFTTEELQAMDRKDFSDKNVYHAVIPAIYKKLWERIDAGEVNVQDILSHTFLVEEFLGSISPEEMTALNEIRTLAFYHLSTHQDGDALRQELLELFNNYQQLIQTDPEKATKIQMIANASGYAPEVYLYMENEENDFQVRELSTGPQAATVGHYRVRDQKVFEIDEAQQAEVEVGGLFDFKALYGVALDNHWEPYANIAQVQPDKVEESEKEEESSEDEKSQESEESAVTEESAEESDDLEQILKKVESEEATSETETPPVSEGTEEKSEVEVVESQTSQTSQASDDLEAILEKQASQEEATASSQPEEAPAASSEDEKTVEEDTSTGHSLFNADKKAQLDNYVMNEFGPSIGQVYEITSDYLGVGLPDSMVEKGTAEFDPETPFVWAGDDFKLQPGVYNIVAYYNRTNEVTPGEPTLYVMAIKDDQPFTLVTQQTQDATTNLWFKQTANPEISAYFKGLVEN